MKNVVISWSSGKDSTLTLIKLLADPNYNVVGLITTYVNGEVPFQHTPIEVVRLQAEKTSLPLIEVELPTVFPENNIYQSAVIAALNDSELQIDAVAFGDMFCNGIIEYRQSYIEPAGYMAVFPLNSVEPQILADEIINVGIKTFLSCVDTQQCSGDILGEEYTQELLKKLNESVDPCGENGEFHTLVYDAPCFSSAINITKTKQITSQRFYSQQYSFS